VSSTRIEEKVGHSHSLSQTGCQSGNSGMNVREPGGWRPPAHLLVKGFVCPRELHRHCAFSTHGMGTDPLDSVAALVESCYSTRLTDGHGNVLGCKMVAWAIKANGSHWVFRNLPQAKHNASQALDGTKVCQRDFVNSLPTFTIGLSVAIGCCLLMTFLQRLI
jgi:hypothetical protein